MKAAPVDEHLILLVKTTAELATQAKLSTAAAELLAQDLADLPREQVLAALRRCRRDGLKRLTVAAVISRLDDGRPAPDEAWTMLPKDARGSGSGRPA